MADQNMAAQWRPLNAQKVLIVDSFRPEAISELYEVAVDFNDPIEARLIKMKVVDRFGVDHVLGAPIVRADRRRISVRVGSMVPGSLYGRLGNRRHGRETSGRYIHLYLRCRESSEWEEEVDGASSVESCVVRAAMFAFDETYNSTLPAAPENDTMTDLIRSSQNSPGCS